MLGWPDPTHKAIINRLCSLNLSDVNTNFSVKKPTFPLENNLLTNPIQAIFEHSYD